jgi:transcriptional regulator with XRE-family HTH domain
MKLTAFLSERSQSDADFARRIGVTPQALSRYKLGKRKPEWAILERIRRETEGLVTPNDFLDELGESGQENEAGPFTAAVGGAA